MDQGKSGAAALYRCPGGGRRRSTRSGRGRQPSERPRPGLAKSLVEIFLESWNLLEILESWMESWNLLEILESWMESWNLLEILNGISGILESWMESRNLVGIFKGFQRFHKIPEIPQDFKIPSEISRFQLRFQKFCTRFLAVADPSGVFNDNYYYPRCVGGHGYSSLLVCLLTRCAWAATGYSSLSVCLFVTSISTHLDAIALRLQHR